MNEQRDMELSEKLFGEITNAIEKAIKTGATSKAVLCALHVSVSHALTFLRREDRQRAVDDFIEQMPDLLACANELAQGLKHNWKDGESGRLH